MNPTLILLAAGLLSIGLGASLPQAATAGELGDHQIYPSSLVGLYFYYPGRHRHLEHCWRPHGYHFGHRSWNWRHNDGENRDSDRGHGSRNRHEDC